MGGQQVDAVVVGAGFAGLYAVRHLRDELGLSVAAFEAGQGVGGTWYWNRYPGARCDSESYYYSYSFDSSLEQEWEWSTKYPEQPEILRYLEHVAERFDLLRSFTFGTRVESAHYIDGAWSVSTDTGDTVRARFFISAVGCLSSANVPEIPGLESFRGKRVHTGRWPEGGVDFGGQKVGLIGTGSTGIQAAPKVAAEASHLWVFQRTPNFSIPARNFKMTEDRNREIKRGYKEIRQRCRESFAGFPYVVNRKSALEVTPAERTELFEHLWEEAGGFQFLYGSFYDLLRDERANETAADFIRGKIRSIVKDPEVAEMLCPWDHPYGTKRPPIDTDYYQTYNRDNVTLVDIRRDPISEITAEGIRTSEQGYPLDIIVFATGFDAMTGSLLRMDIRGRNGIRLSDHWAGGPSTYLGLVVAGFPNMFIITGPGSPSVLANMPMAIEQHVQWIGRCISEMSARGASTVEATRAAADDWDQQVAAAVKETLYAKANSWYLGANIPGKERVFMPYTGGFAKYEAICNEVADSGYPGLEFAAG